MQVYIKTKLIFFLVGNILWNVNCFKVAALKNAESLNCCHFEKGACHGKMSCHCSWPRCHFECHNVNFQLSHATTHFINMYKKLSSILSKHLAELQALKYCNKLNFSKRYGFLFDINIWRFESGKFCMTFVYV